MAYFKVTKKQEGGGSTVEVLTDHDNYIANAYVNPSTGQLITNYAGWTATPFIEVTPDEVLTIAAKTNGGYYFSWYDENKTWINGFILSDYGYVTQTVPSNAYYVRFSNQDANMAHFMAWRGL